MAAVTALLVLVAAVVAAVFLRNRSGSTSGSPGPSPAGTPTPASSDRPSSAGPTTASGPTATTCAPEGSGPTRRDEQFTAQDGTSTVVKYSISLPEGYYASCDSYPVLFALHGKDQDNVGFLNDAVTMRRAMEAGVLDQAIIVTPDSFSTGRWENRDTGPAEDNFIRRLIPYIEQNYRVRPGAANRLLVGFSMGGHGAIRFGLKYPDLFAAVWSVDGAMASSQDYFPFVEGHTSADFHIRAVGGQLNGSRVQTLIDDLAGRGIEIPFTYQDREHTFPAFVEEDEKAGWVVAKFLQENLGRAG